MEETVVWRYLAVLLTDRMVIMGIMAREETVVLRWDKVLRLTVKMDMKVG
jgi:hypothetical protein